MQIKTVDFRSPDAPRAFTESLRSTGFGVVSQHPIKPELVGAVYAEWAAYFGSDAKHADRFNEDTQDGYFPFGIEHAKDAAVYDLKEFFHVYPWGRYPQDMSDRTRVLCRQLTALAQTLLGWVQDHTPDTVRADFSMPLPEMMRDSERSLFRILHYPPLEEGLPEGAVRAAAHEDINLLTVLVAATEPGLEVRDTAGRWHAVRSEPGTIVVNVGDMLQMCSGGYYPSTTHRVVNPSAEAAKRARLSMPLFLHPRDDVPLSATHTANSYRLERLGEIGLMKKAG